MSIRENGVEDSVLTRDFAHVHSVERMKEAIQRHG